MPVNQLGSLRSSWSFLKPEDNEYKDLARQASKYLTKQVHNPVVLKNCKEIERKGMTER